MLVILSICFLFLAHSVKSRNDFVTTIKANSEGPYGDWQGWVYCPDNSYAFGFKMRIELSSEADPTALNSIEMGCFDYNGVNQANLNSYNEKWGGWYAYSYCVTQSNYVNYMKSYKMRLGSTSLGSISMKSKCLSGDEFEPPGASDAGYGTGSFGNYADCPSGTVICGFRSKFQSYQGWYSWEDDTALNHIEVACCRTCDLASGFYLNGNSCELCHYTCKTCSSSTSSSCTSCHFSSHSLSSGVCQAPSIDYQVAAETPPSGWTGSPSIISTQCGYVNNIIGGYAEYGSGAYVSKLFSNIPPYFHYRIWTRLIKIDSWDNEIFRIYVNTNLEYSSPGLNSYDNVYTSHLCGMTDSEDVNTYIYEKDVTTPGDIDIKIDTSLNEVSTNEAWGILYFALSVSRCHETCKSCNSQISTSCLTCYNHATKQPDNSCLCDDTYYAVSSSPCTSSICTVCTSCYTGCRKCTNSGSASCQSCITGYYLSGSTCYSTCPSPLWGNNGTLTCDASCTLSSQYGDPADRICKPCDSTCETCSAGGNNNCRTCSISISSGRFHQYPTIGIDGMCLLSCSSPNPYAHNPSRRCQSKCPLPTWGIASSSSCEDACPGVNYYKLEDATQRICAGCHSSCASCSGSTSTDCLSCSGSLYLYGTSCLSSCGTNKYGDSNDNTCKGCTSPCKECTTPNQPTVCTSCSPPNFLKANQCVNSCDPNQYKDYSDQSCKNCHTDCLTCFGPSNTECSTCSSPKFHDEDTNQCVSSCASPKYSYIDIVTPAIRECLKTCLLTYYGNNVTRTCDANCANTNEFKDDADNICKPCHSTCTTCSGPNNNNCLTCSGTSYLTVDNKCDTFCGDGYYGQTSDHKCYQCTANCLTCETPNQPTKCLSCGVGFFLLATSNQCLVNCPVPKYGVTETHTCDDSCLLASQYLDPLDRICKNCDSTCKTCTTKDPNTCLTCDSPLYFLLNECKTECPKTKMYPNSLTKICESCASTCQTCSGASDNNCLSCISPYFLYNNQCISDCPVVEPPVYGDMLLRVCVVTCPQNCYVDKEARLCKGCDAVCETCFKEGDHGCLTCKYGLMFTKELSFCAPTCPSTHFQFPNSFLCKKCDDSCATCTQTAQTCLTCQSGYYPSELLKSNCLRCDQTGQYLDLTRICRVCSLDNCKTCQDSRSCKVCFENYYLKTESEIQSCEMKTVIKASVTEILNPRLFVVEFSDIWSGFFANMSDVTKLSIDSFTENEFNYTIEQITTKAFQFIIKYSKNVIENSLLKISFQPNEDGDENKVYVLEKKILEVYLNDLGICQKNMTWSRDTKECVKALAITPELLSNKYDPESLVLEFDEQVPDVLVNQLSGIVNISIINFQGHYQAEITQDPKSKKSYNIELYFSTKFNDGPILTLNIVLTSALKEFDSFYFTKSSFSVKLPANYKLEASTKKLVESSANATKQGAEAAQSAMMISNVVNAGSSVAMKSLMLMEIIRFLRFIDINYPPNVIAVFQNKLDLFNILPTLKLDEDPLDRQPDGVFNTYGVSPYIINNHGGVIANTILYFLISLAFLIVNAALINNTHPLIEMIMHILKGIFIWNFLISIVLSNYQISVFYSFAGLKWYSLETKLGIIDFSIAAVYACFILSIPIFIFYIIRKLRKTKSRIQFEEVRNEKKINTLRDRLASIISLDKKIKRDDFEKHSPAEVVPINGDLDEDGTNNNSLKELQGTNQTSVGTQKKTEDTIFEDKLKSENSSPEINDKPIVRGSFFVSSWGALKAQDPRTYVNKRKQSLFTKLKEKFATKNIQPQKEELAGLDEDRNIYSFKENEIEFPTVKRKTDESEAENSQVQSKTFTFQDKENIEQDKIREIPSQTLSTRATGSLNTFISTVRRKSSFIVRKSVETVKTVIRNLKRPLTVDENKEKYSIFLKDYKEAHALQQYFLLLDLLRQISMTVIVLMMTDWPFSEILSVTSVNFLLLVVLIWKQPYLRIRDFIQNLINEVCLLLACTSALYIAYLDKVKNNDMELKFQVGWLLVGSNMFLIYFFILRFFIEMMETIHRSIKSGIKFYNERRAKEIQNFKMRKMGNPKI